MGRYDEYLERSMWGPSEPMQRWVCRRILTQFARVAQFSPSATDLLEVGTGTGRCGVEARALGFRSYTGIEPTKALAEHSRSEHGLNILDDALPNLTQVPDNSVDAVLSMHVLEHAPGYGAARDWCEEMGRVVRPGGAVLIVAPDVRDYREYFWDADWSHGWPPTPRRVAQIYRDLGFDVEFEGSMHLGRLGGFSAASAHMASFLIPTHLGDAIGMRLAGRPLASGLKIALLWGLVFVIARRPSA